MKYVLDTSAILSGKDIPLDEDMYVPSGVLTEISEGGRWHRKLEMMRSAGLTEMSPPGNLMDRVRGHASKTGDDIRLSETDIEVIALAIHVEGTILTDDYSIQNLAKSMGVEFKGIAQEEIDEQWEWEYRCEKCHRWLKEPKDECPRCGGEVKSARLVR
ncbi:MAG: nucleic acid-binding protein [Candidatus Thermoplasmatota archaeon]|nr:nucleic acid-binding protein [Candidatus Thermoplasmatota archaeon]MBS3790221.1 nucleic acid-binding protein [Candidatus Thermoplasmatota archaeon]